jgi:hypothetical protein
MDFTDGFDKQLPSLHGTNVPSQIVAAAVYVRDTMNLAKLAAESVFKDKATPELALAIYDRIDAERLRLVTEQETEHEK